MQHQFGGTRLFLTGMLLGNFIALFVISSALNARAGPPMGDDGVVGPMRGLYVWLGQRGAPTTPIPNDHYARFMWSDLESTRGHYNFARIDAELQRLPPGGSFSFRVMALNSFYDRNGGVGIPTYVVSACPKGFDVPIASLIGRGPTKVHVPDWNCPVFLERVIALLTALGERYDRNPRIGYVDIGIYGNWGEWHLTGIPPGIDPYTRPDIDTTGAVPGTAATREAIVDAHVRAFPHTQLLMMTDDKVSLVHAMKLATAVPIGLRRDSFGSDHFDRNLLAGIVDGAERRLVEERWKTAPFVVECMAGIANRDPTWSTMQEQVARWHLSAIGNGGFGPGGSGDWVATSPAQKEAFLSAARTSGYHLAITDARKTGTTDRDHVAVAVTWVNEGVAPTYLPWLVEYRLCGSAGCGEQTSGGLKLASVLPRKAGAAAIDRVTLRLPPGGGEGGLEIRIKDARRADRILRLDGLETRPDGFQSVGALH